MLDRRQVLACSAVPVLSPISAFAQASQPLLETAKILLGVPPGGLGDKLARALADKLRGVYAHNVIVENKTGAAGQLAAVAARDGAADGSNLLLTISSSMAIYPYTYAKLPYKVQEFAPVSLACYANHGLAIGPSVPEGVKNLNDFLTWAKANPSLANYGSPAAGSIAHLVMASVAHNNKIEMRHIPYRGSGPGVLDMLGGQIAAMSTPAGVFLPHMASGKCRVIAISGAARASYMPSVATYREQGQSITAREWYGFFLPGKAKPETIRTASLAFQKVFSDPVLAASFSQLGLDLAYSSPQELSNILKSDDLEWRDVIRDIGFTADS
jgi:tripartite-type tricarboxylate transporter receptor subunit TctC